MIAHVANLGHDSRCERVLDAEVPLFRVGIAEVVRHLRLRCEAWISTCRQRRQVRNHLSTEQSGRGKTGGCRTTKQWAKAGEVHLGRSGGNVEEHVVKRRIVRDAESAANDRVVPAEQVRSPGESEYRGEIME